MPPPTTWASDFRHSLRVYNHYAVSWAALNWEMLTLLARLLVFFAKVVSITKPCAPGTPKDGIWYPLFGLAAVELAIGSKLSWRVILFLAGLHITVLSTIVKFWGVCAIPPTRRWIHEDGMSYQTSLHY